MMKRCLYALLTLLFSAAVNASEGSNRFERTARALDAAPEESREALARNALEELAAALLAEAELARVEVRLPLLQEFWLVSAALPSFQVLPSSVGTSR